MSLNTALQDSLKHANKLPVVYMPLYKDINSVFLSPLAIGIWTNQLTRDGKLKDLVSSNDLDVFGALKRIGPWGSSYLFDGVDDRLCNMDIQGYPPVVDVIMVVNRHEDKQQYLLDFRSIDGSGSGYVSIDKEGNISSSVGTIYIDNVISNTIPKSSCCMISIRKMSINAKGISIGSRYDESNYFSGSIFLVAVIFENPGGNYIGIT